MIQRIQSIYLLLSVIFSIVAIAAPIPYAFSGETAMEFNDQIAMIVLAALIAVVSLANIFLFNNRKRQMLICNIITGLTLVMIGVAGYFSVAHEAVPDVPYYGTALPGLVLVANLLAKRGIQADENLVRSADRLR
ncbi:MAG: DUF4293 domain-containing protein [Chitinophagales bacterium]